MPTTIRSLCATGKTVFLTTHFMDEAQHLADRVAVMVDGQIVASGPPEALGGRDELPTEIRFVLPAAVALGDLPDMPGCGVSASHSKAPARKAMRSARPPRPDRRIRAQTESSVG